MSVTILKMKSMTTYKKWDIVLIPFPFTNLRQSKKRPALILSPNEYNEGADVIIAFMTSNITTDPRIGDYHIKNWENSGLPKPTMVRMKLATVMNRILVKKLGRLENEDQIRFKKNFEDFFTI